MQFLGNTEIFFFEFEEFWDFFDIDNIERTAQEFEWSAICRIFSFYSPDFQLISAIPWILSHAEGRLPVWWQTLWEKSPSPNLVCRICDAAVMRATSQGVNYLVKAWKRESPANLWGIYLLGRWSKNLRKLESPCGRINKFVSKNKSIKNRKVKISLTR